MATETPSGPPRLGLVFAALMLAMSLAALDQTIVVTAYLLTETVATPLWGKLGDRPQAVVPAGDRHVPGRLGPVRAGQRHGPAHRLPGHPGVLRRRLRRHHRRQAVAGRFHRRPHVVAVGLLRQPPAPHPGLGGGGPGAAVDTASVEIVWDEAWTMDRLSAEARGKLVFLPEPAQVADRDRYVALRRPGRSPP